MARRIIYKSVVFVAVIDLIFTAPFAIPGLESKSFFIVQVLDIFFECFTIMPEFDDFHLFLINSVAAIASIWSIARIIQPVRLLGIIDMIGRVLLIGLLSYHYYYIPSLSPVVWIPGGFLALGAVIQLWTLKDGGAYRY